MLIRGVGPSLVRFGIVSPLANPVLRLYQGSTVLATNDDWCSENAVAIDAAAVKIGAFALDPGSKDAAILMMLAPGVYTAQLAGTASSTGVRLLEVYEVP